MHGLYNMVKVGRPRKAIPKPKRRARGTGSVGVRKDGRVFAILPAGLDPTRRAYYGPGDRRAFATVDEADVWLASEIARRRNPAPETAHAAEEMGSYLTRWLRIYGPGMAPRTFRAYRGALRRWLPYLGRIPLGELTHERVQGAMAQLRAAQWQRVRRDGKPTSIPRPYSHRTLVHGRTVLGYALAGLVPDILPANPVRRVRIGKVQSAEPPVWDADEGDRFLETVAKRVPHLMLAFRLVLKRGLRRGEVVQLRWDDVDEHRGVLVIDETAGERAGEGGDTKGRRTRDVPLTAAWFAEFRTHRKEQRPLTPWVFANPATGKPWHAQVIADWAARLCAEAGLTPITPKDMRATCATTLLDEGVPLPRVSQLLGHANVAITAAFYERVLKQRADRATRVAEEMDAAHERAARDARRRAPTPLNQTGE